MSGKRENKKRRVFNTYNLLVLLSIIIILGAGYVLLERQGVDVASYLPINEVKDFFASIGKDEDDKNLEDIPVAASSSEEDSNKVVRNVNTTTPEPTTKVQSEAPKTNTKVENGEISEEMARTIAKGQFEELGEKNVNEEGLEVIKIKRKEEMYYYVSSENNNEVEIKISDGTIARVNGVVVE